MTRTMFSVRQEARQLGGSKESLLGFPWESVGSQQGVITGGHAAGQAPVKLGTFSSNAQQSWVQSGNQTDTVDGVACQASCLFWD